MPANAMPGPGGECNSLTNAAPVVDNMFVAADMPAATGGEVVDGTYWKTAVTHYTGSGGKSGPTGTREQTTLLLSCGTFQLVTESYNGASGLTQHVSGVISAVNGDLRLQAECGYEINGGKSPFDRYDATPDALVLYDVQDAIASTYTRQ